MKKILLFGAGKSATSLIDYLLQHALAGNWLLIVVDADRRQAEAKIGNALGGQAVSFDINETGTRQKFIGEADIVISLLPPSLHIIVAKDCIEFKKNLLTASYIDEELKSLRSQIEEKGLLFLCEMGLDPGIDHMSAKKMIDNIRNSGGTLTSILSHCGGLVAPENDTNPWRYKVSWNPRNVVMAGKAGAVLKKNGRDEKLSYRELFSEKRYVNIPGYDTLCWYPNRDSLPYLPVYGMENIPTFIRTTLRHPDFMYGWKNIIDLKLTDEEQLYETDGKSLRDFFKEHLDRNSFSEWLKQKMQDQFESSRKILEDLVNLVELEEEAKEKSGGETFESFMVVTDKGNLQDIDLDELKTNAAATVAAKMKDARLILAQLFYLGLDDHQTIINQGKCSAADVLRFALEKKLALLPGEKDLVVMMHEIVYEKDGKNFKETSTLLLEGKDDYQTAMAKTVGLPLGIAARLILEGKVNEKGLIIPLSRSIYEPVLAELEKEGIRFTTRLEELGM